jgi:hypothetical protein
MAEVEIGITARDEGYARAMEQAKNATTRAVADIKSQFSKVGDAFATAQRAALAFTAVLAGGAAFREIINRTVNLTVESITLGRQLGISAGQASVLKDALGNVFATTEQFQTAARGLTNTLRSDEEAVSRLGVATRGSNGEFRNTVDIMLDVNKRLASLKEGTDRNVEGARVYGRAWLEVAPILALTAEGMDEAREKAQSLGLIIGVESIEQTNRYRAAMDDAGDVVDALAKVLGDALLPVLTDLANWFGSIGPDVVARFRAALVPLQVAFIGLRTGVAVVYESIKGTMEGMLALGTGLANAMARALVFDFSGARDAWRAGWDELGAIGERMVANVVAASQKGAADIAAVWANAMDPIDTPTPEPAAGGGADPSGGRARMPELEARLAQLKVAFSEEARERGQFLDFGRERERAYWRDILATERVSADERLAIRTKVAQLALAIDKEAFDGELGALRAREAEYRSNLEARLVIVREYAARVGAAYGEDSRQYQDAARRIVEIEREKQAQLDAIRDLRGASAESAALAQVDAEATAAAALTDLGATTAEELVEQEASFEARRFEIRRAALEDRLRLAEADPDRDPVAIARIHAEIQALELAHDAKLREIRVAGIKAQVADWRGVFGTIEGGFSRVIAQFLRGTLTIGGAVRGLFVAVAEAVVQMLAQVAAQWLANAILQRVIGKTTAASTIAGHSAAAGAAGVASMAGAPFPINLGAPAFGLAMAAAAAAYGAAIPAAAGGFDIPAGINPITQLHSREMVLPAPIADGIREMIEGSGGMGGGPAVTVQVSALDAQTTADWLRRGGAAQIAKGVRSELAKFNPDLRASR